LKELSRRLKSPVLLTVLCLSLFAGCSRAPKINPSPTAAPVAAASGPARLLVKGTQDVPVIMYHDVIPKKDVWFDLTVKEFDDQMAALKSAGANVVPLADVVAHLEDGKPLPDKAIALTFDDGTLGDYTYAWPVLKQYNYPATFFVHTGYVGRTSSKEHMTWDQLRELQATGLIDIQPHTVNHPDDLRLMTDEDLRHEIDDSKAVMEKEMGTKVRFFAYPNGNGDERVAQVLKAAGYEAAWNEERAWDAAPADRFFLPRFAPFRLNDILERWRKPEPARAAYASFTLPAQPAAIPGLPGLDAVACAPRTMRLEGGRLRVSLPDDEKSYRVERAFLSDDGESDDGFTAMPDPEQWTSIGRPIVLSDGTRVVFARYQPWRGKSLDALNVLMPNATLAFLGADWYRPGSETQEVPSRLRAPDFLLHGGNGSLFAAGTNRSVAGDTLSKALSSAGIEDALLLR
jgi:peptidoglycan/xylan/chitin deacetylase (PgdA/CDA1 family)